MTAKSIADTTLQQLQRLSSEHADDMFQLANVPDWNRLESAGAIPSGSAAHIQALVDAPNYLSKFVLLVDNPSTFSTVLEAMIVKSDEGPARYLLSLINDICREDTSRFDEIAALDSELNVVAKLYAVLKSSQTSSVADKSAYLISAVICHKGKVSSDSVFSLTDELLSQKYHLSICGSLAAIDNLLKVPKYRVPIWNIPSTYKLLSHNLHESTSPDILYYAIFAVWAFSFTAKFISHIVESTLLSRCLKVLNATKKEKLVRLGVNIVKNCLEYDGALEIMIHLDTFHTLTLLEYENWRDKELYADIREVINSLNVRINAFSNYERYVRELNAGELSWSVMHSEKFWTENFMAFEDQEFHSIKKLVDTLNSNNPITLAVACFDLGEFARLHPTGKLVLSKFRVKERVLALLSNKDRAVAREALLCMQKLMLNNWQDVSTNRSPTVPVV